MLFLDEELKKFAEKKRRELLMLLKYGEEKKNKPVSIIFDGDNTLWKSGEYFEEAKGKYKELLQNIFGKDVIDDKIMEEFDRFDAERVKEKGFSMNRFKESMLFFVKELSKRFKDKSHGFNSMLYTHEIEQICKIPLKVPPDVYDDVLPALNKLKEYEELINVYVFTSGDEQTQKNKFFSLDDEITTLFIDMFITKLKTERAFKLVKDKIQSDEIWMIGDSIKSDINNAIKVGFKPIWIHRKEAPSWAYEDAELVSRDIYEVENLVDAIDIIIQNSLEVKNG